MSDVSKPIPPEPIISPPSYCQYAAGPCPEAFDGRASSGALFFFSSDPPEIARTVKAAATSGQKRGADWKTWRDLPIAGQTIFCEICKAMRFSGSLVADVSTLNFNLLFEIGFGIGVGKPVIPIRDVSFTQDKRLFDGFGMLDTLGYVDFVNSEELAARLFEILPAPPLSRLNVDINVEVPLYVLKSPHDTDGQIQLLATIKKSALRFRAFDPQEIPRLSLHDARIQVAQSIGVVAHLSHPSRDSALIHNARCALVCGMAMAQQKVVVILQETHVPQPIDYRDVVLTYGTPDNIPLLLDGPVREVVTQLQSTRERPGSTTSQNLLETIDLGDVAAENEITELDSYFVQTGQANLARQGRARLVVGRKGTGKTAIFYRIREELFHRRTHLVLDMKPEGHQFKELRETVLSKMGEGVQEHTMVAFWNYILLAELARKIIDDWPHARHDPDRLAGYERVEEVYKRHNPGFEADFSQRLLLEANRLAQALGDAGLDAIGPQLTELIFSGDVRELNEAVSDYLTEKETVWLLIDNLDKGWPIRGSTPMDILIVRSLLEATRKLQRELEERGIDFHCLVFLRTDIYEHLVVLTPDKGKDTAIRLDWEDSALFEEIIRRRIVTSTELDGPARELWARICVSHVQAEDTFNYVVERTLMRPRDLLLFVRKLIEVAINRGHDRIEADDIPQAERAYSEDMLLTTAYEIADTHPRCAEALYAFQGAAERLGHSDLVGLLLGAGLQNAEVEEAINLLLWFGFLGVSRPDGELYSHSVQFNISRLRSLAEPPEGRFVIHPAFRAALGIAA